MVEFMLGGLVSIVLSLVVIGAGVALSKKASLCRLKVSPFECGFTPQVKSRLPFSILFFLIGIIFIIFDVELVILFPFVSCAGASVESIMVFIAAIIILVVGLYHEINQGGLNWAS